MMKNSDKSLISYILYNTQKKECRNEEDLRGQETEKGSAVFQNSHFHLAYYETRRIKPSQVISNTQNHLTDLG